VTLAPSRLMVTTAVRRVCLMDIVAPSRYSATVQQQIISSHCQNQQFSPIAASNRLVTRRREAAYEVSFLSGWWHCVTSSLGRDFSHHAQAVLFVNDKLADVAGVWFQADDNPVARGAPHTVGAAAGPEV